MAVLDDCPGLKVEVKVAGEPLREYDDDEAGSPKTITKYIEARSGAEFSVIYTFSEPFPIQEGVKAVLYVDGKVCCHFTYKPQQVLGKHVRFGVSFWNDGKHYHRKFSFRPLNIVEDTEKTSDMNTLQEKVESTGCITMTFQYVTDVREKPYQRSSHQMNCLSELDDIPEKALKGDARSHQATLSAPKEIKGRNSGYYLRGKSVGDGPFATFHFKYRSKDALKALRIIPSETEGIPQEGGEAVPLEERPEEELTPEELRKALRRMRRREANVRNIKRERDADARIKRERNVKAADQDDDEVTVVEMRQKRPRVDPDVIVLD